MGFILPSTIHYGSSWENVRNMLALLYENMTIISIAHPTNKDAAFSADTAMNEVIVIARKADSEKLNKIKNAEVRISDIDKAIKRAKQSKTKTRTDVKAAVSNREQYANFLDSVRKANRGKFVSLHHRPHSVLLAAEIGRIITRQSESLTIDGHSSGGSVLMLGNQPYGTILDCPVDRSWWFVGVADPTLVQCAYALMNSVLRLPKRRQTYDVPMTLLGDKLGFSTRDIGEYVKTSNGKTGNTRSPFFITPLNGVRATRYALWNNDNESQTSMLVKSDSAATEKKHATQKLVNKIADTATHVHINRLNTFPSQCLSVLYTAEKSLGGESIPNVLIGDAYEKAFTVWSNSTLGILCFWASSGRQQIGRGTHSRTSLQQMPVLDFTKLHRTQVNRLNKIFDKYKSKPLLAIRYMYRDETRIALDKEVADVLGIHEPLDDLRIRLSREPSINGGQMEPELSEK